MPTIDDIAHYQTDFLAFSKYIFRDRKGFDFVENWHHLRIAEYLERVLIGQVKRLVINIPPRYSKTELAVVNWMAWCMGLYPDSEFIHASYSKRLAALNAWQCKGIVESPAFQDIFNTTLKHDSKAKDEWRTTSGGCVYATGSDGTITGYGAGKVREGFGGAIIIDDPHKASEATSSTMRANVIDWFGTTMESRLNTTDTPIIVIMQRLHEEDLAGWLLDGGNGEEWTHLNIPVLNEQDEPLWPFKHSRAELQRMADSNPYVFAGQYMQHPVPAEGGMIKKLWPQRYHTPPANPIRIVQSWDTAFKASELNDPSACLTFAETKFGYYLLDVFVDRMEYPRLKSMVMSQAERWKADAILIEDKASGQSLLQELKATTRLPVIAVHPEADKQTRISAQSSHIEAGRLFLPDSAPWLPHFEQELFLFPLSKNFDQIDALSQFLKWVTSNQHQYAYSAVKGAGSGFKKKGAW